MSATIFEALREDHERQRTLLDKVSETQGDSEDRRRLFAELKKELAAHAASEEKHFYSELMNFDATLEAARHGVAEHKELDDRVEALEAKDMSSPQWLKDFGDLEHRVLHHLEEEEREFFQQAGKALTEAQKVSLAGAYRADMARRRKS